MWHFGSKKCFTIIFISCASVLYIATTSAAPRLSPEMEESEAHFTLFLKSCSFPGTVQGKTSIFLGGKVDWWGWWCLGVWCGGEAHVDGPQHFSWSNEKLVRLISRLAWLGPLLAWAGRWGVCLFFLHQCLYSICPHINSCNMATLATVLLWVLSKQTMRHLVKNHLQGNHKSFTGSINEGMEKWYQEGREAGKRRIDCHCGQLMFSSAKKPGLRTISLQNRETEVFNHPMQDSIRNFHLEW
jgi:hypothetical protein